MSAFILRLFSILNRRSLLIGCLLASIGLFVISSLPADAADPLDSWHYAAAISDANLSKITYGNGLYVTVGYHYYGDTKPVIYTSFDACNWTQQTVNGQWSLQDIVYGNGTFVTVGLRGTILTSADGTAWYSQESGITKDINAVTFGNGIFVAVGEEGNILTSPDGVTWTLQLTTDSIGLNGITYGNGLFVTVGGGSGFGMIYHSPDGIKWTPGNIQGKIDYLTSVAYGNGKFAAGSMDHNILASADGSKWTMCKTGATDYLEDIAYGGNSFVGVGLNRCILTSTDGYTWKQHHLPYSGDNYHLFGVVYANGRFSAVGPELVLQSDSLLALSSAINTNPSAVLDHTIPRLDTQQSATGSSQGTGSGSSSIVLKVNHPNMTVNGTGKEIDPGEGTSPIVVNGRVFVPIRALIEALGGNISWSANEQKITISLGDNVLNLWIGQNKAQVDGQAKTLDAAPFVSGTGRTMLPLRFVTENLGYQVVWNGSDSSITITR